MAESPLSEYYILAPGHTADAPRLTRLSSPADLEPAYWDFITGPVLRPHPTTPFRPHPTPACAVGVQLADIATDLLGPNVRYHSSKINFKYKSGGEAIAWHQVQNPPCFLWLHKSFYVVHR